LIGVAAMTKNTPATLRIRASKLGLRIVELEAAAAAAAAATPSPSTTISLATFGDSILIEELDARTSTKSFVLADMDGRPRQENNVCLTCAQKLPARERIQVVWDTSREQQAEKGCRLCAVGAEKPEAYTKPFCDFLTENPTIFHTVEYFKKKLGNLGYEEVGAAPAELPSQNDKHRTDWCEL
jgi:aminopeptidase I